MVRWSQAYLCVLFLACGSKLHPSLGGEWHFADAVHSKRGRNDDVGLGHDGQAGRHGCPSTPEKLMQSNDIVRENCAYKGADSREWDVNGSGDPEIQGFADKMSYSPTDTVTLRVKSTSDKYRVDVYRLGYYRGNGARLVGSTRPTASLPQEQPDCLHDKTTLLVDCGNWSPSASFELSSIPGGATSGIYIARLTREDSLPHSPQGATWREDYSQKPKDPKFARPGPDVAPDGIEEEGGGGKRRLGKARNTMHEPRASHVYFVVRSAAGHGSDVVFQTSDATYQAYNRYGGSCTYGSYRAAAPLPRSYVASYNRPFENRDYRSINLFLGAEYPAIRFLERNGYDVSYMSGQDIHRYPGGGAALSTKHKIFLSVGHDEYWSRLQRANIEAARDLGLHLQFWSGNQVFWKVRWEHSKFTTPSTRDDSNQEFRTMVCYKETQEVEKIDPRLDMWTGTFRDGRAINPEGPNPENSLSGVMFGANAWRNDPLIVPRRFSLLPIWRATPVQALFQRPAFLNADQDIVYPGNQLLLHGASGGRFVEPWAVLKQGVLGHEWDEDVDNGHRPPGMIRMSETRIDNICYIQDSGSIYDTASGIHRLVLYRTNTSAGAESCDASDKDQTAIVFGSGTVQWSWGLDDHHDNENGLISQDQNGYSTRVGIDLRGPDRAVQQATVNLFAMMSNVQPQTLEKGLVPGHGLISRSAELASASCSVAKGLNDAFIIQVKASPEIVVAGVELFLTRWHPADPDLAAYLAENQDPSYGRLWRVDVAQQHLLDHATGPIETFCRFTLDDLRISKPHGPFIV